MKRILAGAVALTLFGNLGHAQTIVFSDNFNRTSLGAAYTTVISSVNPANPADGGASIVSDRLQLTNDATTDTNNNGRVSTSVATSSFSAPYNSMLSSNTALVSWTFNMRQIRTDPSGFSGGSYGAAFVLGGTTTDFSTGNGYAVVLGNSTTIDPIRLVSYTGGLAGTLTEVITSTGTLSDVGTEYLSLRVTYNPIGDVFTLFGRNDGSSSFADPTTGTLTLQGSGTNSTYTSTDLTRLGEYWNFSTAANQTALFDNVSVSVVPEPTTFVILLGGIGLLALVRRRR